MSFRLDQLFRETKKVYNAVEQIEFVSSSKQGHL